MNFENLKTIFKYMFIEEWRLHTELFSDRRFGAYPLVIAVLLGVAAYSAVELLNLVESSTFIFIVHILIFLFGIQTGSIAFESRDAVENLLGEITPLLYADKTLPVNPQSLVGVFIVKDVLFYAGFFFLPVSVAIGAGTGSIALIPLLFLTISILFCLGLTATIFAVSLGFKSKFALAVVGLLTIASIGYFSTEVTTVPDYGTFSSPLFILGGVVLSGIFGVVGAILFEPPRNDEHSTNKTDSYALNLFKTYSKSMNFEPQQSAIYTKTVTDIFRSSGGIWKVLFSTGMLAAIGLFLIHSLESQLGITPHYIYLYVSILMMGAFTTYAWIHQVDSIESYSIYPITPEEFSGGKAFAFHTINAFSVVLFTLPVLVYYPVTLVEIAATSILLFGFTVYYYGLVYYFSGTRPTEFLFDSNKFTGFSIGVMAIGLPTLIIGLFGEALLDIETVFVVTVIMAVILAIVGSQLHKKGITKWKSELIG